MIFQAYQTLDTINTTQGLHTLLVYVNDVTSGLFTRLLLFAFFLIIAIGSYLSMQRTSGRNDLAASCAMGGYVTSGAAIIMSFIPGVISGIDIVVTIALTILFTLWLLMSRSTE